MMIWFHYLHIPLYTELNFHVRKSQSVAGTFLFGCSFKKRMKNLEGKINSWKMKFILTRKLKAYSHAKQLEKLGLSKSLWMRNDKVQLNEAAVKLKQKKCKRKKLTFLPPFPNNLKIKIWNSGSIHLPPSCTRQVHLQSTHLPFLAHQVFRSLKGPQRSGLEAYSTKGKKHWRGVFYFLIICISWWKRCRNERKNVFCPQPQAETHNHR